MLVSVLYFHFLRRAKARLGLYRNHVQGLAFYQYAFTADEMKGILHQVGSTVLDTYSLDAIDGLKDDISVLRKMRQVRGIGWRFEQFLGSWKWLERNLGHMILFVCRKDR